MNRSIFEEGQVHTNMYVYNTMDLIWSSSETNNNLWLGSLRAAENLESLVKENIKAVISIAEGVKLTYPEEIVSSHFVINALDIESYEIK